MQIYTSYILILQMSAGFFTIQIQPTKHAPDRADNTARTRQRDLDHTEYMNQRCSCPEKSKARKVDIGI